MESINKTVAATNCNTSKGKVISNRAMNLFLLDKTAYASESTEISFYTNFLTFNTCDGNLTINHNFHSAKGIDEPITSLTSVDAKANLEDGFKASVYKQRFKNDIGIRYFLSI